MRFFHRCGKKKKQDPVLEAFNSLYDDKNLILRFVERFENLVDEDQSVVTGKVCSDFINELSQTSVRLVQALDSKATSQTLTDDLIQFIDQLSLIKEYYQSQIQNGQPVARSYLVSVYTQKSKVPLDKKNPQANTEDLEQIRKYKLNNNANVIMNEEINAISVFILRALKFTEDLDHPVNGRSRR